MPTAARRSLPTAALSPRFTVPVLVLTLVGALMLVMSAKEQPVVFTSDLRPRLEIEAVRESSQQSSPQIDDQIFFFNRIHKTGSTNFVQSFLQVLAERNGFTHRRAQYNPDFKGLDEDGETAQLDSLDDIAARPLSYDRHVYFFDFEVHSRRNPIWFSLVREPVSKFESRYYYSRNSGGHMHRKLNKLGVPWLKGVSKAQWREKDMDDCVLGGDPECDLEVGVAHHDLVLDVSIPYFCGYSKDCQVLGSRWALQQAKKNVEKWYPVVGVLEELNSTLLVLEEKLPRYFDGIVELYESGLKDQRKNHGAKYKKLSAEARAAVSANLTVETEFYQYIRQRLHSQLAQLEL